MTTQLIGETDTSEDTRPIASLTAERGREAAELERRRTSERDRRRETLARAEEHLTKLLIEGDTVGHVSAEQRTKAQVAVADAELEIRANDATIEGLESKVAALDVKIQRARQREQQAMLERLRDQRPKAMRTRLDTALAHKRARDAADRLDGACYDAEVKDAALSGRTLGSFQGGISPLTPIEDEAIALAQSLGLRLDTTAWRILEHGEERPTTTPAPPVAAVQSQDDQVDDDIDDQEVE